MKKYLKVFIAASLFVLFGTAAIADGIEFNHGNWEELKATAKAQHKLIFVDFYTTWCGPCKLMANTIFPLKDVGDFYNKNFICVQIDAEKGEGIALARKYSVNAYPTMMFTNAKEEVIRRAVGSSTEDEFLGQGKLALTATADDLTAMKVKYIKNELSKKEFYQYFLLVKAQGDDKEIEEVFDRYFVLAANVSVEMFKTISENVQSPDDKAFVYLLKNREDFASLVGKEKVDVFVRDTYIVQVMDKMYKTYEEYLSAKKDLKVKVLLTEKEELNLDLNQSLHFQDRKRFIAAASKLADRYFQDDDLALSNLIGGTMHLPLDKDEWLIVKSWAERALALKDNALNSASLALVYMHLKDKGQAIKYIDQSIADCQRDNETYGSRIEMFKKEITNAIY